MCNYWFHIDYFLIVRKGGNFDPLSLVSRIIIWIQIKLWKTIFKRNLKLSFWGSQNVNSGGYKFFLFIGWIGTSATIENFISFELDLEYNLPQNLFRSSKRIVVFVFIQLNF